MDKPKTVRIGQLEYQIEYKPAVVGDDQHVLYGESRTHEQRILISDNHGIERQKETLLHEVLHAIDEWYNFNGLEERHVTQITHGVFDFIKQNKDAIRWIIEDSNNANDTT